MTIILSVIFLYLFISYFIRIRWAAFLTFLPALFGAIISLALLYFIKGTVSSIALGVGSILLGIGVDYALYIFSQIKEHSNARDAIQKLWFPIVICSVTTAAVFYCLIYVKTGALHDLGLFMTFSVLGSAVFSILVFPFLIDTLRKNNISEKERYPKFVKWFATYRFDKNKIIVVASVAATVVLVFTSRMLEFDSDMQKMSYESQRLKDAENHINKITSVTLKSVFIMCSGKTLDEAMMNNEKVLRIVEKLKNKNIIRDYSSFSNLFVSDSTQLKRIEQWESYWTPKKKKDLEMTLVNSAAQIGFNKNVFDGFFSLIDKKYSVEDEKDLVEIRKQILNDWVVDFDNMKYIINVIKVDDPGKNDIYSAFENNQNITVVDRQTLTSQFIGILKNDFNLLVTLSSYLVLIILILIIGRIELGLVAFIPIVISWIWTQGIMGILGERFTIFNIIISTLIFGTGVDYCILIMRGLQHEYAYGKEILPSFKLGIFLSASTTIISVGVLVFAKHPALKSIAVLPIVGYLSVVLITFTFEPVMMNWMLLNKKKKNTYPVTLVTLFLSIFAYTYFISGCILLSVFGYVLSTLSFISRKKRKTLLHSLLRSFCKSMIYVMVNVKKKIINEHMEDFSKPAVIICNHKSVLDILLILMMSPKVILLTNDWVWNSPFFGKVVQFAQFYPVSLGVENSIELLSERVNKGYSIVVFPEGTRSADNKIHRFHKGAFYIAEKLNLDILPVMFHGTGDTIKKGEFFVRNGRLTVKVLKRISITDKEYGSGYSERTKLINKYFRSRFQELRYELETPEYFTDKLVKNFIYKETILEWYLRIKLKLEKNFDSIVNIVPMEASVTDIGCGYGFLSYMLNFTSDRRIVLGIDADVQKIEMANNCFSKNSNINFIASNVVDYQLPESDVFIMMDVLHYLSVDNQKALIKRCAEKLNDNGIIIIREANDNLDRKHFATRLTEFFSVGLGFNKKTDDQLFFCFGRFF